MKDIFFSILATVLSVVVVGFGLKFVVYYINSDGGILPFLVGLVGFFIAINPAMNQWEKILKKLFKVKDEE
jgi:hypothetical protein